MAGLTPASFGVLAVLVFFAGVVDALAGGGGLITLPAYLAAGLPPALLLGTNKLASGIGTVASCANYQRRQRLPLRGLLPALAAAVVGSYLGARAASLLNPAWIRLMLLVLLPAIAGFLWTRRDFGAQDTSARHAPQTLSARAALAAFPIGAYDGFFGPGTGTFFALALVRACGYDMLGATGRAKLLNLATNLAALGAFLAAGRVDYRVGLSMGAVSLCGHYTGSHLGLTRGARAIRPAVIFICALLFLKLLLTPPAAHSAEPVQLRNALASELRAVPDDSLGWEASDLLTGATVAFTIGRTAAGPDGRPSTAEYSPENREIRLAEPLAREKDPAALARRIAPTVVHELEHARADLAAPGAPVALEGEWTAYAAEAVFVRRRLAADASYLDREPLGRLRENYAMLAKAGDLDGVRRACEGLGLFRGLPPLAKRCPGLPRAERKRCEAAVTYYRGRLAELREALQRLP